MCTEHPGSSQLLLDLHREACEFQAAALATSTQREYSAHVRRWAYFCLYTGVDFARPPEAAVCCYAALLARTVMASTVKDYLKGVRDFYRNRGYPEFGDPVCMPALYKQLKGIERTLKSSVQKKVPIVPGMLLRLREALDLDDPKHAALWAAGCVAFFGCYRKSNVATASASTFSDGECMRVCDIRPDSEQYALAVAVPGSKTRQKGGAPEILLAGMPGHPLDAVAAV